MVTLLFSADDGLVQQVREALAGSGRPLLVATSVPAVLSQAITEPLVVLLLDETMARRDSGQLAGLVPHAQRILLQQSRDARQTLQALRDGYISVLLLPDDLATLPEVLGRLERATQKARTMAHDPKRTIALYSATGGAGRTLIAAHLASAVASQGANTLLIDFNLHTGTLRHLFGVRSERSLVDLVPVLGEFNETHLRAAVTNIRKQLDLLAAPEGGMGGALNEQETQQLLSGCRRYYDVVILDLPSVMAAHVATALRISTKVVYLLNPDPIGLWSLAATMEQWKLWELGETPTVVLNHRHPPLVALEPNANGMLLSVPIQDKIAYDAMAAYSDIREIWDQPGSLYGLAAEVRRLAGRLLGKNGAASPAKQQTSRVGGWWAELSDGLRATVSGKGRR